jgi:DNA-binding FadR family transcriptional regulator
LTATPRLYQSVAKQIADMIETSYGKKGWRMPSERELAEQFGVSRPVIREAIIALEMRGVVEVKGRAGIVVLNAKGGQFGFDATSKDIGPGPFELLEARMALEASAAAIAAEKISNYDLGLLEQCIEQMQHETDVKLLHEKGDRDFHLIIAKATGNAVIYSMVLALWSMRDQSPMWSKLHEHIHAASVRPLWIGDHHAILVALRIRNSDAAYKAMARHIRHVGAELLEADERGRIFGVQTDDPNVGNVPSARA